MDNTLENAVEKLDSDEGIDSIYDSLDSMIMRKNSIKDEHEKRIIINEIQALAWLVSPDKIINE